MFFNNDDDDSDNPREWRRIVWGLFGAALAAYAAYDCFTTGEATYRISRYFGPYFQLRDEGAFALGIEFASLAIFLHFHYFWAFFPRLGPLRRLIRNISLAGFVVGLVFVLLYIAAHLH